MKKVPAVLIIISMLCVNISFSVGGFTAVSEDKTASVNEADEIPDEYPHTNYFNIENVKPTFSNDFGVWVHTKYNGVDDSQKLEIDLTTFKLMLNSGGWKYYEMDFGSGQSTAGIQFSRTQIYVDADQEFVDVVQTRFTFETTSDTSEDFEVFLEVRFPFSLLKPQIKSYDYFLDRVSNERINRFVSFVRHLTEMSNGRFLKFFSEKLVSLFQRNSDNNLGVLSSNSESYFCARIGYASPENDWGPDRVETRFFFGRNKLRDPRVLRMKVTPFDLGREFKLSYINSYLTVDESGNEAFYRIFSVDFEPAAELQITSVLKEGKIGYVFGSSAGTTTKISLMGQGGLLSNIIQSFTIDPLPSDMSFDLTVLGERSFEYKSDRSYSVTYMVDSVQEGNLVKLELEDLPAEMTVEWGLNVILLGLSASGFIDVDMTSDITRAALSLYGSEKPFIEVGTFPRKLRVDANIDVLDLQGNIELSKYSGATTTITVPVSYDKWDILGTLNLASGSGSISFNLPSGESDLVSIGLDTNDNTLFGIDLSMVDTQTDVEVLNVGVDGIATDDLYITFEGSNIENLQFSGEVTELNNLIIAVDFQGIDFEVSGSWDLGDEGSFLIEVNKEVDLSLDNIEAAGFVLDGSLSLDPDSELTMEWIRGDTGHFLIQTQNINAEADVPFGDKYSSNIYFSASVVLSPSAIVKFEWEWGQIGRVMVFTNLFEELGFEVGFNYDPGYNEYQYGLKAYATDVGFTRTLRWDVENGFRFWWLGDNDLPSNWDVQLLWNYEWRDVL